MDEIQNIINRADPKELRAFFAFNKDNSNDEIALKFNVWARYLFMKYFTSKDCDEHEEMDLNNIKAYRADIDQFVNAAFRGFSKTARTKLFIAYCIANDLDHSKRFLRCLSADFDNAKQSVTDIYNMFVQPRVKELYPEIFSKTNTMREETMSSFTTSTGIKLLAKQIGVDQRGKIMEDAKSDFDWYDDIETKTTIRSAVITQKIWENMEEARTGLALKGSSIYTVNYFSEAGNVHKLVKNKNPRKIVQITPIIRNEIKSVSSTDGKEHITGGKITWDRYSIQDIDNMFQTDEDFEGERQCNPNASKDIYFNRSQLDKMPTPAPIKEISGFKMWRNYNPSHRYAGGVDVAGGVGLDSSASVFIDFDTIPAQVVATYSSNMIAPEAMGDEVHSQANRFGGCILAIENNRFEQCIMKAKMLGAKLFMTPSRAIKIGYVTPTTWGWQTNTLTKNQMMDGLKEAIDAGLIELNDKDLIEEAKSYTRNDIIDNPPDPRLTTRHFDLLTACAIAWQMMNHSKAKKRFEKYPGLKEAPETNPAV